MLGKIQIIEELNGKFRIRRNCSRIQQYVYGFTNVKGFPGAFIETDTEQEMRDILKSSKPIVWA